MEIDLTPKLPEKVCGGDGGSYHAWCPNELPMLREGNIGAAKLALEKNGFALPRYSDSAKVAYVLQDPVMVNGSSVLFCFKESGVAQFFPTLNFASRLFPAQPTSTMPLTVPPLPATVSSAAAGAGSEIVGNRKRSRGRCKIPMAKINVKSKNHVAFSKRRKGLFKKASELCVLTGAEIAIVTFSGAGKAFTFGHPSAHAVIERYLLHLQGYNYASASSISNNSHDQLAAANSAACTYKVEGYDQYWLEEMKVAAAGGSIAGHGNYVDDDGSGVSIDGGGGGGEGYWWDRRFDNLSLNELESYMAALQGLRDTITNTIEEDGNPNLFGSTDAYPLSSSYCSLRGSAATAGGSATHGNYVDDDGSGVSIGGGGGGGEGYWWDQRVDDLSLNELESYMAALQGLRDTIITKTSEEDGNVNLFGSRDASPLSSSYSSLRGSGAAAGAFGHDLIVEDDSGGFVLVGQADPRSCSAALCNGCRRKHYEEDDQAASDLIGLYSHGI